MEITINATKEELEMPFPNFLSKMAVDLEKAYNEAKEQKADTIITFTVEKAK